MNEAVLVNVSSEALSKKIKKRKKTPTLAEVDKGGQRLQPNLGVVHPHQEPSQGQAVLRTRGRALLVLHLQLQSGRK